MQSLIKQYQALRLKREKKSAEKLMVEIIHHIDHQDFAYKKQLVFYNYYSYIRHFILDRFSKDIQFNLLGIKPIGNLQETFNKKFSTLLHETIAADDLISLAPVISHALFEFKIMAPMTLALYDENNPYALIWLSSRTFSFFLNPLLPEKIKPAYKNLVNAIPNTPLDDFESNKQAYFLEKMEKTNPHSPCLSFARCRFVLYELRALIDELHELPHFLVLDRYLNKEKNFTDARLLAMKQITTVRKLLEEEELLLHFEAIISLIEKNILI